MNRDNLKSMSTDIPSMPGYFVITECGKNGRWRWQIRKIRKGTFAQYIAGSVASGFPTRIEALENALQLFPNRPVFGFVVCGFALGWAAAAILFYLLS